MIEAPILGIPEFDKPFELMTDASDESIAGTLQQDRNNSKIVIAYISKALNKAQKNYSTSKKELYAIYSCCRKLISFLGYGQKVIVFTDHRPLTYLLNNNFKTPSGKISQGWPSK